MNAVRKTLILSLLLSLSQLLVSAQSATNLRGLITDTRGRAIAGARVVLLAENKLAVRETTTNERGEFSLLGLAAGQYAVSVEADGLTQPGGAQPLKLDAGRENRIIPLTLAAIEDSIIISASRIETRTGETPASAFVVSATELLRAQRECV
ncbi:MAG: carboxypeptidase-like regulatory domain-containing protein [Acidobacteriota bacterium]